MGWLFYLQSQPPDPESGTFLVTTSFPGLHDLITVTWCHGDMFSDYVWHITWCVQWFYMTHNMICSVIAYDILFMQPSLETPIPSIEKKLKKKSLAEECPNVGICVSTSHPKRYSLNFKLLLPASWLCHTVYRIFFQPKSFLFLKCFNIDEDRGKNKVMFQCYVFIAVLMFVIVLRNLH